MIEVGRVKVRRAVAPKSPRSRDYPCLTVPKAALVLLGEIVGKEARVIVDEKKRRIIYEILDSSGKPSEP